MPSRSRIFDASVLPATSSRHQNVVAVELLAHCGMISGADLPDSLAGGTLLESETCSVVGNHPLNIADSALMKISAEGNAHPFETAPAMLGAVNWTTVVNGTVGCERRSTTARSGVRMELEGETLKLVRRTNS